MFFVFLDFLLIKFVDFCSVFFFVDFFKFDLNLITLFIYYLFFLCFLSYFLSLEGIFVNTQNTIKLILYMELIFITLSFWFVLISFFFLDISGCVYALLLITVSAVDSALSFGLLIAFYKLKKTINLSFFLNTKQ